MDSGFAGKTAEPYEEITNIYLNSHLSPRFSRFRETQRFRILRWQTRTAAR